MTSGKIAWKQLFSPTIRSRALSYFRAGKVKKIAEEEDGTFTGTVRGTRNYQVTIGIEDDKVSRMTCSCPYAEKGEPCKHEAAMLYQMEQENPGSGLKLYKNQLNCGDIPFLTFIDNAGLTSPFTSGRAASIRQTMEEIL